ncbi:hypothetical protein J6590_078525 [Homalodisca vitripennis]|nr:hypothetical protein J6590_078525 [Homalodisca vitripennis]
MAEHLIHVDRHCSRTFATRHDSANNLTARPPISDWLGNEIDQAGPKGPDGHSGKFGAGPMGPIGNQWETNALVIW